MVDALIVHTAIPKKKKKFIGEHNLAKTITEIPGLNGEVWFNIDHLPGVTEIDVAYFHKKRGLYLLEVKSLELKDIKIYDSSRLILVGNQSRQHPITQVKNCLNSLQDHFARVSKAENSRNKPPFMQVSVIWPLIWRQEWTSRFNHANLLLEAESMIFRDDLANSSSWLERLAHISKHPLRGRSPSALEIADEESYSYFRRICTPSNANTTVEEIQQVIEMPVKKSGELAAQFPPPKTYKVSIEGPPGTGKTTVLREIGLMNARAGANVLHICFNKVLAAEQRREYQLLMDNKEFGTIDVFDEWEFYGKFKSGARPMQKDQIYQRMKTAIDSLPTNELKRYDTILVDESQDLSQSLFETLELVARPTSSWFLAYGAGQEVFNFGPNIENPCQWVSEFRKMAITKILHRSFRNTTRAFLLGQAFWQHYPNLEKSFSFIGEKIEKDLSTEITMELDLQLPRAKNDFVIQYLPKDENLLGPAIQNLLLSTIEEARNVDKGKEIMIVVSKPASRGELAGLSSYEVVKVVLEDVAPKYGYEVFDIVEQSNRRLVPNNKSIRIVNHQQVRGLSASHVIVLDLDLLEAWCNDDKKGEHPPLKNLGYVCLSRSKASTIIGIRSQMQNEVEHFLQQMLDFYRSRDLEDLDHK